MALVLNEFGIRGRVGNVVFCKLNGKSYMRSLPDRIDPNTPKQQEVRSRFRVAVRFYKKIKETPLKGILDLSADKICSSGYALFMKKNLKAFRANGKIGDFSQLHFSAGLPSNRSFSPKLLEGVEVLRVAEKAIFPLERGKGVRIHLYCFFESPDGKRFSNSQYIKL